MNTPNPQPPRGNLLAEECGRVIAEVQQRVDHDQRAYERLIKLVAERPDHDPDALAMLAGAAALWCILDKDRDIPAYWQQRAVELAAQTTKAPAAIETAAGGAA